MRPRTVRINAYRQVIDGLIANHRDRDFGSAGDSVVAEFASPVEAVRCAISIQTEIEGRNAGLPRTLAEIGLIEQSQSIGGRSGS